MPFPFTNLFLPDLGIEGVRVQAGNSSRQYTAFYGVETLIAGPRVPFLITAPQNVLGASVTQKLGHKLQLGARAMFLTSGAAASGSNLFAPGEDFRRDGIFSGSALYTASEGLQFYGELSASASSGGTGRGLPLSFLGGPVWNTKKLTLKANYIHEAPSYLPIAGYFLGDRSGPYGEANFRPIDAVEVFASASDYRNNIEHSPDVATYRSVSSSAGASVALPYRFTASGQLSTAAFSVTQPGVDGVSKVRNQQLTAGLSKQLFRHNLRVAYRDIKILSSAADQTQKSGELEDIVQFRHISAGGALRDERLAAGETRNTVFVRGTLQAQFGRFSAYAYVEHGDDLANRTVFATNTFNTTVMGGALRLRRSWNLQVEASRNQLTTELNAENIFLLQKPGRLREQCHRGRESMDRVLPPEQEPALGPRRDSGRSGRVRGATDAAHGDNSGFGPAGETGRPRNRRPIFRSRWTTPGSVRRTDSAGIFEFPRVPEGRHHIALAVNRLPVDYDPGRKVDAVLDVKPRRVSEAGMTVIPLASFSGRIIAPEGAALDSIVVRLLPTERYTTPAADGSFAFYNLREGEYDVVVERTSLPEFGVLDRGVAHVVVQAGGAVDTAVFRLRVEKPEKPIHHEFEAGESG